MEICEKLHKNGGNYSSFLKNLKKFVKTKDFWVNTNQGVFDILEHLWVVRLVVIKSK